MIQLQPCNYERFIQANHLEFSFGDLIYALLRGKTTQETVKFAVAASALKHTIEKASMAG